MDRVTSTGGCMVEFFWNESAWHWDLDFGSHLAVLSWRGARHCTSGAQGKPSLWILLIREVGWNDPCVGTEQQNCDWDLLAVFFRLCDELDQILPRHGATISSKLWWQSSLLSHWSESPGLPCLAAGWLLDIPFHPSHRLLWWQQLTAPFPSLLWKVTSTISTTLPFGRWSSLERRQLRHRIGSSRLLLQARTRSCSPSSGSTTTPCQQSIAKDLHWSSKMFVFSFGQKGQSGGGWPFWIERWFFFLL